MACSVLSFHLLVYVKAAMHQQSYTHNPIDSLFTSLNLFHIQSFNITYKHIIQFKSQTIKFF